MRRRGFGQPLGAAGSRPLRAPDQPSGWLPLMEAKRAPRPSFPRAPSWRETRIVSFRVCHPFAPDAEPAADPVVSCVQTKRGSRRGPKIRLDRRPAGVWIGELTNTAMTRSRRSTAPPPGKTQVRATATSLLPRTSGGRSRWPSASLVLSPSEWARGSLLPSRGRSGHRRARAGLFLATNPITAAGADRHARRLYGDDR
jgi:hypothetical protein